LVRFQTSQGVEVRGTLARLGRHAVVFEIYNPSVILQVSEVLPDFRVIMGERTLFSGRAVVRSQVDTGVSTLCEVSLDELGWNDVQLERERIVAGGLAARFSAFLAEWWKLYRVRPEYKLVIADMQTFFLDLKLWIDQVELAIRSQPSGDRLAIEQEATAAMASAVIPAMNEIFERFESVALGLESEEQPMHRIYMRRQLHPLLLCAPFASRAFYKPMGYAGDYEIVNMMASQRYEGGSLFAKVVNAWFLEQPPAQAHRNRIRYLADQLTAETLRTGSHNRPLRVMNIACGPAQELQLFIAEQSLSDNARVTLVDFSEETLQFARRKLEEAKAVHDRKTPLQFVRKPVQTMLKESGRTVGRTVETQYDLVYCAGLFDYLSNQVCQRLVELMYNWLAPGGLLLATNVEPSNPLRQGMEHLLDWHLIYRTAAEFLALRPRDVPAEEARVYCEETGYNVFLAVRKAGHA
jgi:extracellular factor (EF) 3-hydroxypalmitic acid methyl ester biosynthesis protein